MDMTLRPQIHHTHRQDSKAAAIPYGTAITSFVFTFIQTLQSMQIRTISFTPMSMAISQREQNYTTVVANACKDLIACEKRKKLRLRKVPQEQKHMQYIAVHFKVARTLQTPPTSHHKKNHKYIAQASALTSFILHPLAIIASIIPNHIAIKSLRTIIATTNPFTSQA
jgi:hypothetical protein